MAELLVASWTAHVSSKGRVRDLVALQSAYDLRKAAHEADPEHTDPAWSEEKSKAPRGRDLHTDLMAFYASKLGA